MTKKMDKELFFSKTREYLDRYLTVQCGKSPHTVKSYRDALTVFRRYVHDEKGLSIMKFHFEDCTRDLVLDYIAYLRFLHDLVYEPRHQATLFAHPFFGLGEPRCLTTT